MNSARNGPDWEQIELEYVSGMWSTRAIARRHNVDEATIRRRALRHGWVRRSTDRIALVRQRLPRSAPQASSPSQPETAAALLVREAEEAASDLGLALKTAQQILRRLYAVAEEERTPQGLRIVAEALDKALNTVWRIRRLDDQPTEDVVVIERSYASELTPPPEEAPEPTTSPHLT